MDLENVKKGDKVLVSIQITQQKGFARQHIGDWLVALEVVKTTPKFIDVRHPDLNSTLRHRRSDGCEHGSGTLIHRNRRKAQPYSADNDQTDEYKEMVENIKIGTQLSNLLENSIRIDFRKVDFAECKELRDRIMALPKRDNR